MEGWDNVVILLVQLERVGWRALHLLQLDGGGADPGREVPGRAQSAQVQSWNVPRGNAAQVQ